MGGVPKQYNFWPGVGGLDARNVDRLILLSKDLPVKEVAVDSIAEIDTNYWFADGSIVPTVRRVVEHLHLIQDVDLSQPDHSWKRRPGHGWNASDRTGTSRRACDDQNSAV